MYTQIHENEIYNYCIYNAHINASAAIEGSKITQATTSARGTMLFANDGEVAASKALQANDSRLHTQGSDTGTTANSFKVNTDHSSGDNSEIVLVPDGAIRFNDTAGYLEYCTDYSAGKTWYKLYSLDELQYLDLSNINTLLPAVYPADAAHGKLTGSVIWDRTARQLYIYDAPADVYLPIGASAYYRTEKTGADSVDPGHTIYELEHGAFADDGINLLVYVNGVLNTHYGSVPDYIIVNQTTIQFSVALNPADVLEMIVYTDIIYRDTQTGSDALDNPTNTMFDIILHTSEYSTSKILVSINGLLQPESAYNLSDNILTLTSGIANSDVLDAVVILKGITEGGATNDLTGVINDTFRVGMYMHEWHQTQTLLFGRSQDEDIGIRNNHGVIEWKDYGSAWLPIQNIVSGGGGVQHYDAFFGSEASDNPTNKEFTLTGGVLLPVDLNNVQVFVNGLLVSYGKSQWSASGPSTIQLVDPVVDSDIIDIYLYKVG